MKKGRPKPADASPAAGRCRCLRAPKKPDAASSLACLLSPEREPGGSSPKPCASAKPPLFLHRNICSMSREELLSQACICGNARSLTSLATSQACILESSSHRGQHSTLAPPMLCTTTSSQLLLGRSPHKNCKNDLDDQT